MVVDTLRDALLVGGLSMETSTGGAQQTGPPAPKSSPYSHLTDHKSVGPGKPFTQAQKAKIIEANMKANGGVKERLERKSIG